jgi:cell wall-associated NlpC family hydrolase
MVIVGWLAVALAAWMLDSAIRNRAPIATLKEIVQTGQLPDIGKSYPAGSHLPSTSSTTGAAPATYTTTGASSTKGQAAAAFALAQVGKPYVWGGTGPDTWDCSGLTQAAWATQGVSIPRTSIMQGTLPSVPMNQLQVGDLITYYNPISHVGMYIGGDQVVSAMDVKDGIGVRPVGYTSFASGHRPRGV